jgi:phage shock protein PspC (stress-responsive transcriptional regulator)
MTTQLVRSTTDRKLAGVAGGVAQTWNIDPTLVRLGFVGLTLFAGGIGLVLYAALWLAMPEPGGQSTVDQLRARLTTTRFDPQTGQPIHNRSNALGIVLIAVGGLILADFLGIVGPAIAVALIAAGWYFLRSRQHTPIS